jgi:hypothetical protein
VRRADPLGFGEGKRFLGAITVTTKKSLYLKLDRKSLQSWSDRFKADDAEFRAVLFGYVLVTTYAT